MVCFLSQEKIENYFRSNTCLPLRVLVVAVATDAVVVVATAVVATVVVVCVKPSNNYQWWSGTVRCGVISTPCCLFGSKQNC